MIKKNIESIQITGSFNLLLTVKIKYSLWKINWIIIKTAPIDSDKLSSEEIMNEANKLLTE